VTPSAAGGLNTFDVTIRFNTSGTALYVGMLRDPTVNLEVVQTTDMTFSTPMTLLNALRATDQPYIYARAVIGWFDPGKDRLWVGNNEGAANPASEGRPDPGRHRGLARVQPDPDRRRQPGRAPYKFESRPLRR
jgi:hypothetical protein